LTVFHTPPEPTATYQTLGSVGIPVDIGDATGHECRADVAPRETRVGAGVRVVAIVVGLACGCEAQRQYGQKRGKQAKRQGHEQSPEV
jgi:hypothetical protein